MSSHRRPRAIGLFSGAGGLDIGLEAAGFRIALAVERDLVCCETLRTNHQWKVFEGDVETTAPSEILGAAKLRRCKEVDLVSAGPPCQPFSKSANWSPNGLRRLRDPRASALHNLMDIVGYVTPRSVLIENVEGFRREGLPFLLGRFREMNALFGTNYRPTWKILNAADYGVPQKRRRLFVVAFRDGRGLPVPGGDPRGQLRYVLGGNWLSREGESRRPRNEGAMGEASSLYSRRKELSLAHRPRRRRTTFRMENQILVISS